MTISSKNALKHVIVHFVLIILAIISIGLVVAEMFFDLNPALLKLVYELDIYIASIFLLEFVFRMNRSKDKWSFLKQNWWELLASIPLHSEFVILLRPLRIFRIARLMNLLQHEEIHNQISVLREKTKKFNSKTYLLEVFIGLFSIVMLAAIGFNYFESDANPNVNSLWDSIWWSLVTVTTVGFGDIVPLTSGGRVVAGLLLIIGTVALATVTAVVASYLVTNRTKAQSQALEKEISDEIDELKDSRKITKK